LIHSLEPAEDGTLLEERTVSKGERLVGDKLLVCVQAGAASFEPSFGSAEVGVD
jgi:hypothetical protein